MPIGRQSYYSREAWTLTSVRYAALEAVKTNASWPERLAAKLVEIAERFKILLATGRQHSPTTVREYSLRAEAQRAIEAGELAKADALLSDVEMEQT